MKVVIFVVAFMACAVSAMEEGDQQCACTKDFRPVCSTDNEMFPNLCNLLCDGNRKLDLGKFYNRETETCEKLCACPFLWDPVCSSENDMYPNSCVLECNGDKTVDETKRYDQEKRACVPVEDNTEEETPADAIPIEENPADSVPV